MRAAFGDRSAAIYEFLIMAGLVIGSLGLFMAPWLPAAAPWGFGLPFLYVIGHVLIEARRQKAPPPEPEDPRDIGANSYDWLSILWSLSCAIAGAAAFVIAWGARPPPPPEPPPWQPPENAISTDMTVDQ